MNRSSSKIHRLTRALGWLAYTAYLILFLMAVDYGFYLHYRRALERSRPPSSQLASPESLLRSNAPLALWNSVGYIHTEKRPGRYFLYPEHKPPGVIRIGAFGDSYTYGAEAGSGLDYPEQLQRFFNQAGAKNVQVLNFGNDWHGFHQAFRIWDQLGRRYGLDFILLGPECFFLVRDTTFEHALPIMPYYLHGRYVLDDRSKDGVRFIDVKGNPNNLYDRFSRYYSFFPSWDYLRYDVNPPMFIESLIPEGRTLVNPFYYRRGSVHDEAQKIREILFAKMDRSGSQVVFLHHNRSITNLAQNVGNILALPVDSFDQFPYVRMDHYGAIGYSEIARVFFSALTGARYLVHESLRFFDDHSVAAIPNPVPMSKTHHVWVEVSGNPVGELAHVTSLGNDGDLNYPIDPAKEGYASFFTIKSSSESVLDGWWSGLKFALTPGAPVALEFDSAEGKKIFPLGSVQFVNSSLSMGYLQFDGIQRAPYKWQEKQRIVGHFVSLEGMDRNLHPSGLLTIDSHPVFQVSWDKGNLVLTSLTGSLLKFRADKDMNVDLSTLPTRSEVRIRISDDGEERIFPIGIAERTEENFPYLRKRGQKYIGIGNGRGYVAKFEPE